MKLESHQTAEEKRLYKLVRTDDYSDVPGEIVTADEDSGEACVQINKVDGASETRALNFGPNGLRIVARRR
jgi:hypothetical protein